MVEYRHYKKGSESHYFRVLDGKVLAYIVINGAIVVNPTISEFEADGWIRID